MNTSSNKEQKEIIIPSLNPYFEEKSILWFSQKKQKIKKAYLKLHWWKENILFLEKGEVVNLSHFLKKLYNLGYEKVQTIGSSGEYSQRGGIIDIAPVGYGNIFRLEFLGNLLENILKIGEVKEQKKKKIKELNLAELNKLKPGDYIVHIDHGIGILSTYQKSNIKNQKYFVIEYAGPASNPGNHDKLYVPFSQTKKLSRYHGFTAPKIHRLGGTLWERTKRKAKEDIVKIAKELLSLYAKREIAIRSPYQKDDEIQKEVESSFEHIETPDQEKTMLEIKNDLEKNEKPMDRLIVADSGFGKTEIALRTSVKSVSNGYQVALLAPTTILADQHYETFKTRLENLGVETALLTRLEPAKKQKEIINNIRSGKNDIVIGTHRILSKDIEFKNLGLVIVDEEQRFGVRQKEKFKKLRSSIDILTLSATPIPRTLYLTLSNLKNISTINTSPPGRLKNKISVLPYSKKIIKKAVSNELKRNGQVFYLHNRIQTIGLAKKELKNIVPNSKIEILHGKTPENEMRNIIKSFREKKFNVLVATTIIENGLDFPNANTLIVADASKLGLSQSYQIKGRVGRSDRQGFAYFLYPSKTLTQNAQLRLSALKEAEILGSGYQVALKDLEIRGAGNILGRQQSGLVNQIGLNLYCQMLSDTIEKLKN